MYPRLYLHSLQSVTISRATEELIFTTRHVNGCWYYFPLTKNQFLNFDDILTLADSRDNMSGHFPLGRNLWLHYSRNEVTLYCANKSNRPYFKFQSFPHYKKYVHERILPLFRLQNSATGRRRRHIDKRNGGSRTSTSNYQRPLSSVVSPVPRSPTPKRVREGRETLSWSPDNVIVSPSKEESAFLPNRKDTNSRWRIDSTSFEEGEVQTTFDS